MRALFLFLGVAATALACESVPSLVFDDGGAGSSSSGGSGSGGSSGSGTDSGQGGDDAANDSASSGDTGGDSAFVNPCPSKAPPGMACCGAVVCRGQPGKCTPQVCNNAQLCGSCSAVCCLKDNGDFEGCSDTIANCPAP